MRAFIAALLFSVLLLVSITPAVLAAPACNGCSVDGRCLPVGYRININSVPSFCGIDGIEAQKPSSAECQDNFECLPNVCSSGRCVEAQAMQDMFTSIYCRLFNLLNEPGYQNCLIEHGAGAERCGDGICSSAETAESCPADCSVDICANLVCDDNSLCTTDGCDPATGDCVFAPIDCDDSDPCTEDYCSADSGCYHTTIDGCSGVTIVTGTGTISVSGNSITGSGTSFLTELIQGSTLIVMNDDGDTMLFTIYSVESDTEATITSSAPNGVAITNAFFEISRGGMGGGETIYCMPMPHGVDIYTFDEVSLTMTFNKRILNNCEDNTITRVECNPPGFGGDIAVSSEDCGDDEYCAQISSNNYQCVPYDMNCITTDEGAIMKDRNDVISGKTVYNHCMLEDISKSSYKVMFKCDHEGIGGRPVYDDSRSEDCGDYAISHKRCEEPRPHNPECRQIEYCGVAEDGVTTAIVIDGGFIVERRPNLCDTITGNDGNQVDMKVFYTCIIREAFRPEIILDNERTGPCGSSEKCVMNGGVPECVPKCAPNSGSSVMSEESCCGDGTIDSGEECDDGNTADDDGCSSACQTEGSCGDGSCNGDETCYECPNDCGDCPPTCGDGICMPEIGEDCVSCPDDCITCGGCGDGSCNGNEDCSSCPGDCGSCGCQPGIASTFTNFIAFFGLAEECPPDPCEGVVCDDGNPCTDDSCSGGVCSHVGNGQCGSICSDGVCRPECPENCNDECTCPDQPPAEQCDGGWSCEDRSGVASTGFFGVLSGFWRSAVSFLTGSVATEPCNKNWVCKPSIFCSDSDGGVNTFLKGTTSVGSQTETDYCVDTFSVMEHWCNSDNKIYSGEFSCKYCIDGACTGDIPEEKECNYNGVQDNEEAGIDCGGGGCPPCMEENDPCADILDMYECLLNSETLNCAWNSDTNTCFKVMNA